MTDYDALCESLRERTALRYMGACKCGKCQLVPREMVDAARDAIAALVARVAEQKAILTRLRGDLVGEAQNHIETHKRAEAAEARVKELETKVGLQLHIMAKLRAEMDIRATLQGGATAEASVADSSPPSSPE